MKALSHFRMIARVAAPCGISLLLTCSASAQEDIHLDPAFLPDLLPQTKEIRTVMPLPDSRLAIIESWEGGSGFQNEMGCLYQNGQRDGSFAGLHGALGLYPWNDSLFFSWQLYGLDHINRHHLPDGVVDTAYQTPSPVPPGQYIINFLLGANVDDAGRAYITGEFVLADTTFGNTGYCNLMRLDQSGGFDPSFTPAVVSGITDIHPMSDGRVLLSGVMFTYNEDTVHSMFMVNGDGSIDNGFNTPYWLAQATSVLPTSDGGFLAVGRFIEHNSLGILDTVQVVKLLPNGSPDPAFHMALHPKQQIAQGRFTMVYSIVPWNAGGYLIAGNFDTVNGRPMRGLAVIDEHGDLDTTQCNWPGPGPVDGRVAIQLVQDMEGGVLAYGLFDGFDDGQTNIPSHGLVRLLGGPVGITEVHQSQPESRLYPSPARDHAWLEWDGAQPMISGELYDAMGRTVKQLRPVGQKQRLSIDLNGLPEGSYAVHVQLRDGTSISRRLQVAR